MKKYISRCILVPFLSLGVVNAANAIDFDWNEWNFSISGFMNGFYAQTNCNVPTTNAADWHSFSACEFSGSGVNDDASTVSNGFLPTWINFKVSKTILGDTKLLAHFGLAPGTSRSTTLGGARVGGGAGGGDIRNLYLKLTNDEWGSLTVGRDAAIFSLNSTFADIAIPGIGSQADSQGDFNATFGSVGAGYIYMAFHPQITYHTPVWQGLQAAVSLVQPLDIGGGFGAGPVYNVTDTPMLQGALTYNFSMGENATGKLWGSFVNQTAEQSRNGPNPGREITAKGYEYGGQVSAGPFSATLAGFTGDALGESILFSGSTDANGNSVETDGYLANAAFKFNQKRTKIAAQYGLTESDVAQDAENAIFIVGLYHDFDPALKFVLEYVDHVTSQANRSDSEAKTVAAGLLVSF